MDQSQQTTIHDLPIEILEKVINPFCVVDKLVCRLWNDVSNEVFDLAFKKHKEKFKPSLDEICSIRYELIKLRDDDIIIGYYPVPERYIDVLTEIRSGKYMSIRQYKNKVSTYFLKNKSICHKKVIVNKIKTVSFKAQTIYYNYVNSMADFFKKYTTSVLPGEHHYQYDTRFIKSYGVPDEIYRNYHETELKKRIQCQPMCLVEKVGCENYSIHQCLLKMPEL
ncbi:hypothetical protein PV-S19_0398 [Pacmanvirus S19]|nr:hypothetical protein PV-S19_0398 [Pacmanvirus S19]